MRLLRNQVCIAVLIGLNLFTRYAIAQEIDRSVYSTSGQSVDVPGLSISYNVGELVVTTNSSVSGIVSQGFEQPDIFINTSINATILNWDVIAYPNPVTTEFVVQINNSKQFANLKIELLDVFGKIVKIDPINSTSFGDESFLINIASCPVGIYFVRVYSSKGDFAYTYKIIKI